MPAASEEIHQTCGGSILDLADVTNLPLKNDIVDAVVSLHTIYHVPKDEQRKAFMVYSRGHIRH